MTGAKCASVQAGSEAADDGEKLIGAYLSQEMERSHICIFCFLALFSLLTRNSRNVSWRLQRRSSIL